MTQPRWWLRWPERLDGELAEFRRLGYEPVLDEAARSSGVIRVGLTVPARVAPGQPRLVVVYPDTYPYLRAAVFAPGLHLDRHQVPFNDGSLCYLGRGTANWAADDLLGTVLDEQLPKVLVAADPAADPALVAELEERQGEPLASYFPRTRGASLLVDSAWQLDTRVVSGSLVVGLCRADSDGRPLVHGAVLAVRGHDGTVLAESDEALGKLYPERVAGLWVRRERPPMELDPVAFDDALLADHPTIGKGNLQSWGKQRVAVIGVVFRDEVAWRDRADAWVFLVRTGPAKTKPRQPRVDGRYFTVGSPAGRIDLRSRIPELGPLADKTIAVVGLGGVGAPAVIELARAGIKELRLLEPDAVDPATAVRWPLGFAAAGGSKSEVIGQWLARDHPYTRVAASGWRIGSIRPEEEFGHFDELNELDALLDGADLVLDATAEAGIHHLLSDLARERDLPYVYAHGTPGGWGGLVARVPATGAGCWGCLQRRQHDGSIPAPPFDEDGIVQPNGCADPTFTAAGFDLTPISNVAVRLIASTLCGGADGAYPTSNWDIAVLTLRRDGLGLPGEWVTYPLVPHPGCRVCRPA